MKAYSLFSSDSGSGNFPPPPPPPGFNSPPPPVPDYIPPQPDFPGKDDVIPRMAGDMKLVGIVSIICGVLYCLTCIGALLGIPFILAGMRLRESAGAFLSYSNTKNPNQLDAALQKQSKYFFIQKIFIIASLILFVLYIIFMIIAFSSGLFRNIQRYEY